MNWGTLGEQSATPYWQLQPAILRHDVVSEVGDVWHQTLAANSRRPIDDRLVIRSPLNPSAIIIDLICSKKSSACTRFVCSASGFYYSEHQPYLVYTHSTSFKLPVQIHPKAMASDSLSPMYCLLSVCSPPPSHNLAPYKLIIKAVHGVFDCSRHVARLRSCEIHEPMA